MDKTLLKGLAMLEMLTEMGGDARTIETIAERMQLTRSNTHRTLQTLIHAGYVRRDIRTGGYRSTLRMFEMGSQQLHQLDVRKLAPAFMSKLARETGDTVHLSILDGHDVVYIDKVDSLQPIRAYSMVGGRAPAHAVATGKALLAAQAADFLDRWIAPLQRYTRSTIVDLPALRAELAKVSRVGYAINRGEWRDGVGGLAATVFDGLERPVAALGISGPLERLSVARMTEYAPIVIQATLELSTALGYSRGFLGASI